VPPDSEQVKVTAECCHEPVLHYFHQLLKRMGYPFPGSPRESESIVQAWRESKIRRSELRQTTKPLPFDDQEICRQLQAVCDYDAQFLIYESTVENIPEELPILDAEAVRQACTAREATIGIAGLVSEGNGIFLKFIPRDAPFHRKTPGRGRSLFRRFIQRTNRQFDELGRRKIPAGLTPTKEGEDGGIVLDGNVKPDDLRKKAEIMQRRREVKRLFKKGLCYRVIASRVGYTESTVKRDVQALGLTRK